jgi:hypothetical protein
MFCAAMEDVVLTTWLPDAKKNFATRGVDVGATEEVFGRVGGMLEACCLQVDSEINLEDVEEA